MTKHSLLLLFAHPDDETTIAPLLLKYTRAGHDVHLISITSGQKGTRPHYGLPAGDQLGAIREDELRCSARMLGLRDPILLGFEDQGIAPLTAFFQVTARVREIVNETRPEVILTWGPDGITGHTDHRVCSEIASAVFQERRLLRCDPKKLYFTLYPEAVFGANPDPLNRKRPFLLTSEQFITTVVDCSEIADEALRSLECHRTQWRPERMEQLKDHYKRMLGGRVYLRLALATVPYPRERETSIFQGLD